VTIAVTRPRALHALLLGGAVCVLLLGVLVEPSLAASKVGKNVGNEIKTWATAILLGVAALVAIPILAKRDMAGGVALLLLVVLIGGFVFAPGAVQDVIDGVWKAVGG
jgi:hypothetical protein